MVMFSPSIVSWWGISTPMLCKVICFSAEDHLRKKILIQRNKDIDYCSYCSAITIGVICCASVVADICHIFSIQCNLANIHKIPQLKIWLHKTALLCIFPSLYNLTNCRWTCYTSPANLIVCLCICIYILRPPDLKGIWVLWGSGLLTFISPKKMTLGILCNTYLQVEAKSLFFFFWMLRTIL